MTRHGGEVRARSLVVIAIGMLLAVAMVPSTRAATLPLIPVANDDKYEVDRPGSLVIDAPGVLANDMWLKSDLVEIVEGPSKGTLSLGDDGSFKYVPDPSEGSGSDAFVYRIRRALVFSDKAKVDLKIIDALNSAKPFKRKLIFTLMEIQDDIVAECPVRGVGASATEAEGVVAASTAKAIVSSLDKLDHQLGIAV